MTGLILYVLQEFTGQSIHNSFWSSVRSCLSLFVPLPGSLPLSLSGCSPLDLCVGHSCTPLLFSHLPASLSCLLFRARVFYSQVSLTLDLPSLVCQAPRLAARSFCSGSISSGLLCFLPPRCSVSPESQPQDSEASEPGS